MSIERGMNSAEKTTPDGLESLTDNQILLEGKVGKALHSEGTGRGSRSRTPLLRK